MVYKLFVSGTGLETRASGVLKTCRTFKFSRRLGFLTFHRPTKEDMETLKQ